jgi:hypothetical protein
MKRDPRRIPYPAGPDVEVETEKGGIAMPGGLVADIAGGFFLPRDLVVAIIRVESGGNPQAMRYEPGYLRNHVEQNPRRFGDVSLDTERIGRSLSWGPMLLVGQIARERGFQGAYFTELCDWEVGVEWGCRHLAWLKDLHFDQYGWDGVIRAYHVRTPALTEEGRVYLEKVRAVWRLA